MLDGALDPRDLDDDGLCNETEDARMTRRDLADTDADGWSDLWEILVATDPLDPNRPERATVVTLRETATADLAVAVEVEVSAAGEDYSGAFEAEAIPDPLGEIPPCLLSVLRMFACLPMHTCFTRYCSVKMVPIWPVPISRSRTV